MNKDQHYVLSCWIKSITVKNNNAGWLSKKNSHGSKAKIDLVLFPDRLCKNQFYVSGDFLKKYCRNK